MLKKGINSMWYLYQKPSF